MLVMLLLLSGRLIKTRIGLRRDAAEAVFPFVPKTENELCGEGGCPVPLRIASANTTSTARNPRPVHGPLALASHQRRLLMIGTEIAGSKANKKHRRQLTINEDAWYASACPFLLPGAFLVQASCPDNKATYKVAALAYRYVDRHAASDQSAFT